jgi:hypothetical protein
MFDPNATWRSDPAYLHHLKLFRANTTELTHASHETLPTQELEQAATVAPAPLPPQPAVPQPTVPQPAAAASANPASGAPSLVRPGTSTPGAEGPSAHLEEIMTRLEQAVGQLQSAVDRSTSPSGAAPQMSRPGAPQQYPSSPSDPRSGEAAGLTGFLQKHARALGVLVGVQALLEAYGVIRGWWR